MRKFSKVLFLTSFYLLIEDYYFQSYLKFSQFQQSFVAVSISINPQHYLTTVLYLLSIRYPKSYIFLLYYHITLNPHDKRKKKTKHAKRVENNHIIPLIISSNTKDIPTLSNDNSTQLSVLIKQFVDPFTRSNTPRTPSPMVLTWQPIKRGAVQTRTFTWLVQIHLTALTPLPPLVNHERSPRVPEASTWTCDARSWTRRA